MMFFVRAGIAAGVMVLAATASQAESRTYDLDAFTAVDISSGINAEIAVGGAQTVRAESPYVEELDELIIEVRDGKLSARTDWSILDFFSFGERQITLFITVPALDSAEASAGADIEVSGMSGDAVRLNASSGADIDAKAAAGKSFRIDVSSGADITIDGACGIAEVDASSGATLRAEDLECADVDVNASSGATARIFAGTSVKANASSGADIEVHGRPAKVEEEESSGGDVDIGD
jgi:hypothetical protein